MEYLFEDDFNSVTIEKELGLKRGDIQGVTIYPGGAVEVKVNDKIATDTIKGKIKDFLVKRGMPKGKKPKEI